MNGIIPQPAPFVPGHEGAGVVAEVGEGVTSVQRRRPRDHRLEPALRPLRVLRRPQAAQPVLQRADGAILDDPTSCSTASPRPASPARGTFAGDRSCCPSRAW